MSEPFSPRPDPFREDDRPENIKDDLGLRVASGEPLDDGDGPDVLEEDGEQEPTLESEIAREGAPRFRTPHPGEKLSDEQLAADLDT
ncbi:hypothetical protein [Lacisediminihabitans changchengi]|uniref:Uncharacterized protein n=1 Tax=Lacisediminihabitans changchengi TaxID=2787634 RepID=A0A934SPD1_9MICO|nr:hypothetical protein [Lacisediminihabitans changchengi]MBK4346535.1 hypothetical protein [Lacisediminihabitans changchengi]